MAGAPLNVALNASDSLGNAITYSVSVSSSNLKNGSTTEQLTTTVPTGNPSLSITVSDPADNISGTMVFQLFQNLVPDAISEITSLVNKDFYDGLTFHRVVKGFMIQGGDPNGDGTGGPGFQWDNEYNQDLQFTSPGVLAMANSGQNTNGSQFFITDEPFRTGDFTYTIIGFMTQGADILNEIENIPVEAQNVKHSSSTSTEVSAPINTVTMTSVVTYTDTQNGVLQLSAPNGTTGSATVTVTASDGGSSTPVTQSFQVNVEPDTTTDPPFLNRPSTGIPPIKTTVNTAASFTIPGLDVNGNAINYTATVPSADTSDLTVSVNSTTGVGTVTPINGASGVFQIEEAVGASGSSSPSDTQLVPVYVAPAALSSIQLLSGSNSFTDLNNSTGKPLQFQVKGVASGATVQLSVDSTVIPTTVQSQTGTTVVLATTPSSTTELADGSHSVTATQTLNETNAVVGNTTYSSSLISVASSPLAMTVDTTPPAFSFTANTAAFVGVPYTCQVTTSTDSAGAVTYQLTQAPDGMAINETTGLITWTPTTTQVTSERPSDCPGH